MEQLNRSNLCSWVMGNVGTYTLSMNAAQLHGDMFLNYALTFLVNMQSAPFLWVVVNRDRIQMNSFGSIIFVPVQTTY